MMLSVDLQGSFDMDNMGTSEEARRCNLEFKILNSKLRFAEHGWEGG
jgi:hypothetical protein